MERAFSIVDWRGEQRTKWDGRREREKGEGRREKGEGGRNEGER